MHKTYPFVGDSPKRLGSSSTVRRSDGGGASIEVSRGGVGGGGVVENSRGLGDGVGGSTAAAMEQGGVFGRGRSSRILTENRRDVGSSKRQRMGAGVGAGPTEKEEESLHRHFALETPLQQVRTTLCFGPIDDKTAP